MRALARVGCAMLAMSAVAHAEMNVMTDRELAHTVAGSLFDSVIDVQAAATAVATDSTAAAAASASSSGGRSKVILLAPDGTHATIVEGVGSLAASLDAAGHLKVEGSSVTIRTVPVTPQTFPIAVSLDGVKALVRSFDFFVVAVTIEFDCGINAVALGNRGQPTRLALSRWRNNNEEAVDFSPYCDELGG